MVKKEDNRKLHGSVLLTVVCVMSLLIVFLFGTLTLATAANNRAHVNYSSAQTDVTSRMVVDSAIRAISANNDYGSFIGSIKEGETKEVNVTLGDGVPNRGRYGDISKVMVEWAGTKDFYDPINNKWTNGGVLKFTSTVSMGGVDSTTSAYVVKQPAGTSSTGKGAGFVTVAGTQLTCQSNLFGGSYINVPKETALKDLDYTYKSKEYQQASWDEYKKDEEHNGAYADASIYDKTYYRQFSTFDSSNEASMKKTAFTLGDHGGASLEADLFVNNNMFLNVWEKIVFPNIGTGISVWGDLVIKSTNTKYVASESVRNPKDKDGNTIKIKFNEIPYIYVDGNISCGESTDVEIGDSGNPFPLNIFCGSINVKQPKIAGDLYCMNPAETSYLGGVGSTKLYKWSHSVLEKVNSSKEESANIYSKGNLVLKQITVEGDVCVEGDLTIGNNVTVNGNVVVGGNLNVENGTNFTVNGKIYYDTISGDGQDKLGEPVLKEGYKEVPTKEKERIDESRYMIVENEKRYYYMHDTGSTEQIEEIPHDGWAEPEKKYKYFDAFGNEMTNLNQNYHPNFYYEWEEEYNPADPYYSNPLEWIKGAPLFDYQRPQNNIDYKNDYFYAKTYVNPDFTTYSKSEKADKARYFFDKTTNTEVSDESQVEIQKYRVRVDADGNETNEETVETVYYYDKDGNIVNKSEAFDNASDKMNSISTYSKKIYPAYAERKVILNLKEKDGKLVANDENSDDQIVKTFDQVLASAANPFKTLPDALTEFITNYTDSKKTPPTNTKTVTVYTKLEDLEKNGEYIIDSDCVLDLSMTDGIKGKILIKPKENGTTLNIIIKKLWVSQDSEVILDDAGGMNAVNLYIDEDGVFTLKDRTILASTTYVDFINNCGSSIGYNSSSKVDAKSRLEDAGRPKINIYGGNNSLMYTDAFMYIAANITSEHLRFENKAVGDLKKSNGSSINNIYYNGNEEVKIAGPQSPIFGCLNAKEVDSQNKFQVIYVTDKDDDPPNPSTAAFDYRVLYYDEY